MLFNTYVFIFVYLPLVLAGYFAIARASLWGAAAWVGAASLFFYGWWNPKYVLLLLVSIAVNFAVGRTIAHAREAGRQRQAKGLLAAGLVFDLGLLAFYKYANFFVENVNALGGALTLPNIVLPLGISFYTFTQIAFLVDAYRGIAREYSPIHYLLFVTYFPHLIAGPVLHHKEMMPQFADPAVYRWNWENIAVGLTIFVIGLAKKVVVADEIAVYVGPVFDHPEGLTFFAAWGGVLAYTFQLYFDFSGYSDMAIGLSRLFGVKLPLNFDSPYKATDIIDFWRRWHMTLSRFLRDYLYIPLGGNRLGEARRHVNLMATMVLGGLWHGAAWTFVLWGTLHGLYLVINHFWREKVARPLGWGEGRGYRFAAWLITFLAVAIAWVLFRAKDLATASAILQAMAGMNGFAGKASTDPRFIPWLVGAFLIVAFAPNTQQIMRRFEPALGAIRAGARQIAWRPSFGWTAFTTVLGLASLLLIAQSDRYSEFLYFQF